MFITTTPQMKGCGLCSRKHVTIMACTVDIVLNVIIGHHLCKTVWTPFVAETLHFQTDARNEHEEIIKNSVVVVGHAPRGMPQIVFYFLQHGRSISAEVIGQRKYGCGLEVPCRYTHIGKCIYFKQAKKLLKL